ncbi:MAG: amidohydrolase family protein [Acidobacteria bacterium]|nr:amidohydrolase family protein [Acidobacteriota bacterium]
MSKPTATGRRDFLASLAGIAAGGLFLDPRLGAQAQGTGPRRIIDVHHHILPPKYIGERRQEINEQTTGGVRPDVFAWTPRVSLDQMDEAGVAMAIVSQNVPGSWFGDVAEGRRISRELNDFAAGMRRDFPGRFGFFATLPLADIDGSLREIEYGLDVLQADGVGIMTSYDTLPPGSEKFVPVFEELNRRGAIVFMHRRSASCCINLRQVPGNMEFVIDDFRALNSLLRGGTLARFPNIRFIHAHGENVLPYLAKHVDANNNPAWAPQGTLHELQKVYIDCAGNSKLNMDDMRAVGTLSTRVMFGSDVPYGNVTRNLKLLRNEMGLTPAEMQAVEYGTAQRLFPKYAGL